MGDHPDVGRRGAPRAPAATLGELLGPGQIILSTARRPELERSSTGAPSLDPVGARRRDDEQVGVPRGRLFADLIARVRRGRRLPGRRGEQTHGHPTLRLPAATSLASAADAALGRPSECRYDDLVLCFEDGTFATVRVADVFAALAHAHAFRALHDELTGLANRTCFLERVHHAQAGVSRPGGGFAVLVVDIDDFTTVNDGLGQRMGDEVLGVVAARLRNALGAPDTVARLGGDDFAALIEGLASRVNAVAIAERVAGALAQPVGVGDQTVSLSVSVGVVLSTPGVGAEVLLHNADLAMHEAKRRRRGGYAFYDPAMHRQALTRLELRSELERALERDEFVLAYQPIVELSRETIVGVEALLRWHRRVGGVAGPEEFIPLSEDTGLIIPIGRWVLREACRQAERWARGRPGSTPLGVAVNISPRQLQEPGVVDDVAQALADSGLDPSVLTLEITEGVFVQDMDTALERLAALKRLGVSLALDDFGVGFSSLGYLSRMPIDLLKLDKAFIADLGNDNERGLASGIIALARSLGIDTVAEGVELAGQVRRLQAAGCTLAQGNFFAEPLPADALTAFALRRAGDRSGLK